MMACGSGCQALFKYSVATPIERIENVRVGLNFKNP